MAVWDNGHQALVWQNKAMDAIPDIEFKGHHNVLSASLAISLIRIHTWKRSKEFTINVIISIFYPTQEIMFSTKHAQRQVLF